MFFNNTIICFWFSISNILFEYKVNIWPIQNSVKKLNTMFFNNTVSGLWILQGVPQNTQHFVLSNFMASFAATIKSKDIFDMPSSCSYRKYPFLSPRCFLVKDIKKTETSSPNWNGQNNTMGYIHQSLG